jgi:hypothetical protein
VSLDCKAKQALREQPELELQAQLVYKEALVFKALRAKLAPKVMTVLKALQVVLVEPLASRDRRGSKASLVRRVRLVLESKELLVPRVRRARLV